MKVDGIDKQILAILQQDGRTSASSIASELDVSIPTITDRIKKLQDSRIIKGIHAVLDPKPLGLDVAAIITLISESSSHYKEVTKAAKMMPEVLQCLSTTGRGSHMLFIITRNSLTLERLLKKIQSWPGVTRTETQIILSDYKMIQKITDLTTIK
jgi:Lrp/AsnC family leucine-responsive transcriptional regulator